MLDIHVNVPKQISHYIPTRIIGKGAFSVVYLVSDLNRNGEELAMKVVPKERLNTSKIHERFEEEIHIFQQMSHPRIIKLVDLEKDDSNFYIFMENCPNGELFEYIVQHGKLSEIEARKYSYQLFDALSYLHSRNVAHRDLKPENLLLDSNNNIKLSDFGFSKYLHKNFMCDTPCGSPCYAAPEIISGVKYDGAKADIWSAGVIIFAMLTGQLPWTKRNQTQLFQQIMRGGYRIPQFLSPECQDFIRSLLTVNPSNRITLDQIYDHPWMLKNEHENEEEEENQTNETEINENQTNETEKNKTEINENQRNETEKNKTEINENQKNENKADSDCRNVENYPPLHITHPSVRNGINNEGFSKRDQNQKNVPVNVSISHRNRCSSYSYRRSSNSDVNLFNNDDSFVSVKKVDALFDDGIIDEINIDINESIIEDFHSARKIGISSLQKTLRKNFQNEKTGNVKTDQDPYNESNSKYDELNDEDLDHIYPRTDKREKRRVVPKKCLSMLQPKPKSLILRKSAPLPPSIQGRHIGFLPTPTRKRMVQGVTPCLVPTPKKLSTVHF